MPLLQFNNYQNRFKNGFYFIFRNFNNRIPPPTHTIPLPTVCLHIKTLSTWFKSVHKG